MPAHSRAHPASVVTGPFDPAYGLQSWDEVDEDVPDAVTGNGRHLQPVREDHHTLHSPGFDPTYPFSPHEASTEYSRRPRTGSQAYPVPDEYRPSPNPSPEPRLPGESPHFDHHAHIISPLSPPTLYAEYPASPPRAAERYESLQPLRHDSQKSMGSMEIPIHLDPAIDDKPYGDSTYSSNYSYGSYSIPEAPPPPPVLSGHSGYEQVPSQAYGHATSRSHSRLSTRTSIARTLTQKFTSSLYSRSRLSHHRRSRIETSDGAHENEHDRDYMELRGIDEREEPIGFDVSSFGAEFAVPSAALQAMKENGNDEDLVYTEEGKAIALANLLGYEDIDSKDSDTFSIKEGAKRRKTENQQSFFFAAGRHVPNWKPAVLQTWYLILLIVLTIGMIIGVELLFQASDKGTVRRAHMGETNFGLFAYYSMTDLSTLQFAVWKYVPTLIGVVYGIIWKVTDEELKRAEPYYQLSKGASGALAAESLNIEYHTIWSPMVPVAALKYRQYIVAAGGLASFLAASTVPIFLSVFIRVTPSQDTRKDMMEKEGKEQEEIEKILVVDGIWTRLLEVVLGIIVMLAVYILYKLVNRRSGLLGDPSGIAGVAAMANKSHILMDFRELDLADEETIHKQLNKRTYILHKGALWQAEYLRETQRDSVAPKPKNAHPLLLRAKGMLPFLAFCLGMLILLPIMVYDKNANVIIDKTPWIIISISILIKSIWELVEKDMRMLEPFWILFNRNADSSVLTLDYSATIPIVITFKALFNRHYLLSWVTFVTILIEVLTVVMGSLDAEGGEESESSSLSSFILAIVIFVCVLFTGVLVLWKRRKPFLPRQPGTISSVLAFIHQSKMLLDFENTEEKTTAERKKLLEKTGHRYGFGWYIGRDKSRHLGIDLEPLLEGYKYKVDPRLAVMDCPADWEYGDPAWV